MDRLCDEDSDATEPPLSSPTSSGVEWSKGRVKPARPFAKAVATNATGGPPAQPPYGALARQIGEAAYRTTDVQVSIVVKAAEREKAAFRGHPCCG